MISAHLGEPEELLANKPTWEDEPTRSFSSVGQLSDMYWPKVFPFKNAYKLKARNETKC